MEHQGMDKCVYVGASYGYRERAPRFNPPMFEKIDMDKITEQERLDLMDMLLHRHRKVYYRLSQI